MSGVIVGGALLVALIILVPIVVVARRAGAVPNQQKIDQADGGYVPTFIDGGSSGSDCGCSDGGGGCD